MFTLIAGAVMIVAGAATWITVQTSLADERITVSDDSPRFAGDPVDGPLTAYQEAQMIEQHYLESTGGKTYAELDREDPLRQTAMTASFLRASLFTPWSPSGSRRWPRGSASCSSCSDWRYPRAAAATTSGLIELSTQRPEQPFGLVGRSPGTVLTEAESWTLARGAVVGRLAVPGDGCPDIFP